MAAQVIDGRAVAPRVREDVATGVEQLVAAGGRPPGPATVLTCVETAAVAGVAAAITPVPGGVGPMTIEMLLANTLAAAKSQQGIGD